MALKFSHQIFHRENHSEILLAGTATPTDVISCYKKIFAEADSHNVKRLLLDSREVELDYDSINILRIMDRLEHELKKYKVARVIDFDCFKPMLIQEVATKKLLDFDTFSDINSAKYWLLNED